MLAGFRIQGIDLLDDHDDLALGFGQRIADLFVHHVDVRFALLDVCLDSFAGSQLSRNFLEVELTESPHVGDGAPGHRPVPPFDDHQRHKFEDRESYDDAYPIGDKSPSLDAG